MTTAIKLANLSTRIASELKTLRTLINNNAADLSALDTSDKGSLVAAINEVVASVGGSGAAINDEATATSSVWSSSKTNSEIAAAIAALVGSAPETLNTLSEIADALNDNENLAADLTAAIAAKADAAHTHAASDITGTLDPARLPTASTTAIGAVELATNTEVATGSDTTRAITAAGLRSVTGDPETDLVTIFEAGLA